MADAESRQRRWLTPALALCIAVLAIYAWPRQEPAAPPVRTEEQTADDVSPADTLEPEIVNTGAGASPQPGSGEQRTAVAGPDRTKANEATRHPQGLEGTVVDDAARPIPGVSVYLIESASNDPLLFPHTRQRRHLLAPIASSVTAPDGSFAVGLAVAQTKAYELVVVSPHHATLRLSDLRLLQDTWHDLGALILEVGTTIRGRVTIEGQPGMPVPQAVITVSSGGAFADAAMRALPNEQGALIAQVDNNGEYELPHAPTRGIVRISAIAPGFARVIKRDVELSPTAPATVNFELPPGKSLSGSVRTSTGLPIANAQIEAFPNKPDLPSLLAFSDERGAFVVHGLRPGPHTIRATAKGFAQKEAADVRPGQLVQLTMAPQNRIQVTVRTPTGRLLQRYRLNLRRFFPKDPAAPLDDLAVRVGTIGSIHEVSGQRVRLSGAEEVAEIHGVPDGIFVCEVVADGFAKTLSAPIRFPIPADQGPAPAPDTVEARDPAWLALALPPGAAQRVEVVVTKGARLRGRVFDSAGAPLEGALVTTQPAGTLPDSPMLRIMQGWTPKRITVRSQRTDADGRYALETLGLAVYQLQVEHPDACRTLIRNIDCRQPGEQILPPITMASGSLVEGLSTVGGRIVGQMKVVLTTPNTAPADTTIRLETVTDGEGRYRFDRRIPPGEYVLRSAITGGSHPDSEIFNQLLQFKQSSKNFVVPPGQDVVRVDLNLPSPK